MNQYIWTQKSKINSLLLATGRVTKNYAEGSGNVLTVHILTNNGLANTCTGVYLYP